MNDAIFYSNNMEASYRISCPIQASDFKFISYQKNLHIRFMNANGNCKRTQLDQNQ